VTRAQGSNLRNQPQRLKGCLFETHVVNTNRIRDRLFMDTEESAGECYPLVFIKVNRKIQTLRDQLGSSVKKISLAKSNVHSNFAPCRKLLAAHFNPA
jgi:hypothetical protein